MILSSDDTAPVSDLPPSDPPEYSDMEDEMGEVDHNRDFLTSDDIPLATTLDDIPLAADEPSSEYIPLAEVIRNRQQNFTAPLPNIIHHQRLRSSSLPTPVQATAESDDILYTPRTEKRHRDTIMTQKRLTTMSLNNTRRLEQAEEERIMKINSRNKVFKDILGTLQQRGYSLAEFLHYVFNPSTLHIFDWRWRGFFRNKETVKEILNYWVSGYNDSTNTLMETWILEQTEAIVRQESKAITDSGMLRKTTRVVDEDFFLGYSLASMTRQLREMAPRSFQLFDAFSTTRRQEREMKEKSRQRQELIKGSAILSLLRSKSQNNNYAQAVLGTYLMATGAQRQHFHVFSSLGTSMSYNSIISRSTSGKDPAETKGGQEPAASKEPATPSKEPAESNGGEQSATTKRKKQTPGTLYLLSQACRRTAQTVAKSHLFMTVYDNVNMMIRIAEQIIGCKNAQENGTCATVIPLYSAALEDIKTEDLDEGIINAPPLRVENLQHTNTECDLMEEALEELQKNQPKSSETIPIHKTALHPLPTMEIDENTINGNIAIIKEINSELGLNPESDEYVKYIKFIAGDQLTIARQRAITAIRLGYEVGLNTWKHFVLITGLFHAKIADTHGTLQIHFGVSSTRSPGSLAFHNTCLDRLPIVLTSLPIFRLCRDLIMISLYARVLHCLLLVSGEVSLEAYAKKVNSWTTIKDHAREILTRFANADRVHELREPRLAAEWRKEANEKAEKAEKARGKAATSIRGEANSAIDLLPTELQGDMAGDSGLVVLVLKMWAFSYRGNGRTKYAHEMLHLLHNLINVWTKEIRHVVMQNWLSNPTGKANAFVEIDLVQEHLNFWIKKIYKADGDAHSWDWLALKINMELGAVQGSKHTVPDLQKDIERLMKSLHEHSVYNVVPGRVVDPKDRPVPDVISVGLAQLTHGNATNPINEFNQQFERLRERRKLTPISDLNDLLPSLTISSDAQVVAHSVVLENVLDSENASDLQNYTTCRPPSPTESENSELEVLDPELEALLLESPTLQQIEAEDVDLDMDGWDLESDGDMSEESEGEEEFE
ncbi:hypothetical protein BDZ97DRAFT_1916079 [Flammula alnicola]|nr:hypothetical protein BDZ97DRAFT_1916079 [Flammula alnicola]